MENQMKNFPKTLEKGMRVKAICMGREIGRYVVTGVSHQKAIMEVEHDPDERNLIAERQVGENGSVVVTDGGLNIQSTEYFVEADEK